MDGTTVRFGGDRLSIWLVIFLGILAAVTAGYMIGTDAVSTIIVLAALAFSIAWLIVARRRWWLLMPVAGTIGGYFYFGFKIYPHELALVGCFVPLLISRAISLPGMTFSNRSPFPIAMSVLSVYLFIHWFGSNIYNWQHEGGGYGNVTRAYFNALWVIIFLFAFRWYGGRERSFCQPPCCLVTWPVLRG